MKFTRALKKREIEVKYYLNANTPDSQLLSIHLERAIEAGYLGKF